MYLGYEEVSLIGQLTKREKNRLKIGSTHFYTFTVKYISIDLF